MKLLQFRVFQKIEVTGFIISSVSKIFDLLRNQIKEYTHKEWSKSYLGELGDNDYATFEIDESKFVW